MVEDGVTTVTDTEPGRERRDVLEGPVRVGERFQMKNYV